MTIDDKLLLGDIDRIASDLDSALSLEEYDEYEHKSERIKIRASDFSPALKSLRAARSALDKLRERLEARLS